MSDVKYEEVDLTRFPSPEGLHFTRAIRQVNPSSSLAIVHFGWQDAKVEEEALGLRLDLDKKIFLDQLGDQVLDAQLTKQLPTLVTFLYEQQGRAYTSEKRPQATAVGL